MKEGTYPETGSIWRVAFRIQEVAKMLGISVPMVERLIRSKELEHVKLGRATLVTRKQLRGFLRRKELETR